MFAVLLKVKKVKKCLAVCAISAAPLWELTCHMGSQSVTCHPEEVTFPPLPQPINRFRDPRGIQGWVDLVGLVTYQGGIPARKWSPIPVLTGLNVDQLRSCDERRYRSAKPPTRERSLLSVIALWYAGSDGEPGEWRHLRYLVPHVCRSAVDGDWFNWTGARLWNHRLQVLQVCNQLMSYVERQLPHSLACQIFELRVI